MNSTNGTDWANEVISNRVTVAKNADSVRVSIKAPEFSMGNNVLALCITTVALAEVLLIYLIIKSNVSFGVLVTSFILLAAGLGLVFGFVKLWLWHNFGEELININGSSFGMQRGYGLFNSGARQLVLNNDSELYTNHYDSWSWREFRGKGVFRLATVDAALTDFGLKLNDQEFEGIIGTITDQLSKLKTPEGLQLSAEQKDHEAPVAQEADEVEVMQEKKAVEEKEEAAIKEVTDELIAEDSTEEVQPPILGQQIGGHQRVKEEIQPQNLAQLSGGHHCVALNDYLRKPVRQGSKRKSRDRKHA
jgi:hypothetical protein